MNYKSYLMEQNIDLLKNKIILFYGENLGLKNDLKEKIKNNNKKAEIVHYTQDEILKDENLFYREINNISLFNEKKIYFVDQANDKILNLLQNIEQQLDNQNIYLMADLLEKKSKLRNYFEKSKDFGVVACYFDTEINLRKIIQDKLKGFKGLSPENINTIINNCSLDRSKLNNELNKIVTFFSNKILESNKLGELLNTKTNDQFNLLKDEALNGDKLKTNRLLSDTTIDAEKNILYLTLINQRLHNLIEVFKLCKDTNLETAIGMLKPPIFWKDKPTFISQARKWSSKKVTNILKKTYNLEIEIKSNSIINKDVLIKKLLVDICIMANA